MVELGKRQAWKEIEPQKTEVTDSIEHKRSGWECSRFDGFSQGFRGLSRLSSAIVRWKRPRAKRDGRLREGCP
jgi:hypothetical protein